MKRLNTLMAIDEILCEWSQVICTLEADQHVRVLFSKISLLLASGTEPMRSSNYILPWRRIRNVT